MAKPTVWMLVVVMLMVNGINAGPAAYAVCQAGCASLVCTCYLAGGFTFGTVTAGVGTPAIILACNSGFGTCQAGCWWAAIAPTP